jgi:two-component system NtrC family sensor kinase
MALQIQFLWVLLRRPISRLLRAYQSLHVALAIAALVIPWSWLLVSGNARAALSLLLFPLLGGVCLGAVRHGKAEEKLIGVAGVILAATVVAYVVFLLLGHDAGPPLPAWAFALFTLAMAMTLANRFSRVHRELDILNRGLEQRVAERTLELEEKSVNLTRKNQEILRAQEKLVRSEKLASLGQLVAGVVHEIRNPVEAVAEAVPELRRVVVELEPLLAANQRDHFELLRRRFEEELAVVTEGTARTTEIVLSLRTFVRPEEATLSTSDLHEGLDSTLSLLRNKLKDRVRVVKNYGDIPLVQCYANQLKQVFMNVLVNAIRAIDGEGVITLSTNSEAGGRVSISIRDTGRGMSESVRRRIFDPFFTTKPKGEGTGLGLSISYSIIEEHGGTIGVRSVQGHGTELLLTLPSRLFARPRGTHATVKD